MTFGPAYQRNFLIEVFKLQKEIEKLGQFENEGLEKVCLAPVTQVGEETKLHQCVVMSLLGLFKNDISEFEKAQDYLKTIDSCTQSPYSIQCLAPYGGPIEPGIAVGGMPKPQQGQNYDYKLATGVVLTFMVKNIADKSQLGPAMKWEKRFVEFLQDYKNDLMDFAYNAERSIEDGIKSMSDAEMWTVILSYIIMFIYITFALGKIRSIRGFFVRFDCLKNYMQILCIYPFRLNQKSH